VLKGIRPKKPYYREGIGEKLLFLERLENVDYDVVGEYRKK